MNTSEMHTLDLIAEARALAFDGYDMEQAAAELGVKYSRVAGWVQPHGLKFVRKNSPKRRPVEAAPPPTQPALKPSKVYSHPKQAIIKLYFYTGATLQESADACGLTRERVRQIIGKLKLVRRPAVNLTRHHSLKDSGLISCCVCRELKPLAGFPRSPTSGNPDRLSTRCKDCLAAQHRAMYADESTGYKARIDVWRRTEKGRESGRAASARYMQKKLQRQQAEAASTQAADAITPELS